MRGSWHGAPAATVPRQGPAAERHADPRSHASRYPRGSPATNRSISLV